MSTFTIMSLLFIIGYSFIIFENQIKINKAATALITGMLVWALYAVNAEEILREGLSNNWLEHLKLINTPESSDYIEFVTDNELFKFLAETSSLIFFLLGAMGIVEVIDRYQGFRIISNHITTRSFLRLTWLLSLLAFFMSAALDNLTTTIVMITLVRKLISQQERKWILISIIVIAANAGGAWSPIGDVTTIMLWIGGQVTSNHIITSLLIPCLVSLLIPLTILSFSIRNIEVRDDSDLIQTETFTSKGEQLFILILGIAVLLSVPIFKAYTNLPPFTGMLLGLGLMWVVTDRLLTKHPAAEIRKFNLGAVIKKIDTATIFYFFGILMAVSALSSAGHLKVVAESLDSYFGNPDIINLAIGALSAIVDNASLVAGTIGMYDIAASDAVGYSSHFTVDGDFWTFLTYCAGTGGSMLLIGSAAGVAAMGMEKITISWYIKRISWMAVLGYIGGALVHLYL